MFFHREGLFSAVIDREMHNTIDGLLDSSSNNIIEHKLNSKSFVIGTPVSTLTPLGWVHVYKTDMGKIDCGLRCDKIINLLT